MAPTLARPMKPTALLRDDRYHCEIVGHVLRVVLTCILCVKVQGMRANGERVEPYVKPVIDGRREDSLQGWVAERCEHAVYLQINVENRRLHALNAFYNLTVERHRYRAQPVYEIGREPTPERGPERLGLPAEADVVEADEVGDREEERHALRYRAGAGDASVGKHASKEPVGASLSDHAITAIRIVQRVNVRMNRKNPLPPLRRQLLVGLRLSGCDARRQQAQRDDGDA